MGFNLHYFEEEGRETRTPSYFELVVKNESTFFNQQGLVMGEPVLNQIIGNVTDSRTETTAIHFR